MCPQVVRSTKHRALSPATHRRLHWARSDHPARRVRPAGGIDRRTADEAGTAFQHVENGQRTDYGPPEGRTKRGPGRLTDFGQISMVSHHMLFCGIPTKE